MRRLVIAFVAASSLALLSACTDDASDSASHSGSTDGVGESRGAELTQENFAEEISSAQLEAGTVHVRTTTSIGGQDLAVEGDAALAEDLGDRAAALSMDLPALGGGDDEPVDLRMLDQKLYVNLGEATGGDFYRVDLAEDDDPVGVEFAAILDQADPVDQFGVLGDSATSFSADGDGGEIDGVPTTRYLLAIDPAVMYEAQGLDVETMVDLPETVDYILYVGADYLPRRMEVEVPDIGTSSVEWSNWGKDVLIEVPDEDEITDETPTALVQG